jgi:anthranilate/para-aminobenzoate synthase component II
MSYDFVSIDNKDSVVYRIAQLLKTRSETGIRKYGTTLDRTDLSIKQWIDHAIEESLDHALYLQKIKNELK